VPDPAKEKKPVPASMIFASAVPQVPEIVMALPTAPPVPHPVSALVTVPVREYPVGLDRGPVVETELMLPETDPVPNVADDIVHEPCPAVVPPEPSKTIDAGEVQPALVKSPVPLPET
jgi:hypothetical protein